MSTLLPAPLFVNPLFARPALLDTPFPTFVTPPSFSSFGDGPPLQEFVDEDFRTELHPPLYSHISEIQLLSRNPQLLQQETSQLPYIVLPNQEGLLNELTIAKNNQESLQLVLLNPDSSTSSPPQPVNTSAFGQLLNTVPASFEFLQMVKEDNNLYIPL